MDNLARTQRPEQMLEHGIGLLRCPRSGGDITRGYELVRGALAVLRAQIAAQEVTIEEQRQTILGLSRMGG